MEMRIHIEVIQVKAEEIESETDNVESKAEV